MHSAYTKVVKGKFGAALQTAFPEFRLSRLQRRAHGGRLYQSSPNAELTLFILLVIHDNADEFNLDIGFSRDGLCPEEDFFLNPNDTLELPSILFRLAEFRGDDKDPWWVLEEYQPVEVQKARFAQTGTSTLPPEKFLPETDALIADAVRKLEQYAAPYFQTLTDKKEPCPKGHSY